MTAPKPLRADAQRNRARVLAAAEELFATRGTATSTEEVARAAGVGIGTVFRHFPTKEDLLAAVFVARLRRLVDHAEQLAADTEPGAAFFTFFQDVVAQSATKQAFADALTEAGRDLKDETGEVRPDLTRALGDLLREAQHVGAVRPEVTVPDLYLLLVGLTRAAEHAGSDEAATRRALTFTLDGLRPR